MDDDLVDDEDFVGGERADDRPEDRDRSAQDGDIDFEDAEDVYDRRVVGHVEDGDSAGTIDAEGYHTAY